MPDRISITITVTATYDVPDDPDVYGPETTLQDKVQIDMEGAKDDPMIFVTMPDAEFTVKGVALRERPSRLEDAGYAPGFYSGHCLTCKGEMLVAKRAITCKPCAEAWVSAHPTMHDPIAVTE